jgi:hypothetical protein
MGLAETNSTMQAEALCCKSPNRIRIGRSAAQVRSSLRIIRRDFDAVRGEPRQGAAVKTLMQIHSRLGSGGIMSLRPLLGACIAARGAMNRSGFIGRSHTPPFILMVLAAASVALTLRKNGFGNFCTHIFDPTWNYRRSVSSGAQDRLRPKFCIEGGRNGLPRTTTTTE